MSQEQLLASFLLDRELGVEIALPAAMVREATHLSSEIRPVSAANDFFAGVMRLRDDIIPLINLKKRLGLARTDHERNARVAVVQLPGQRYGLLVDDIRDVLRVDDSAFVTLSPALRKEDRLVTRLVKLDGGRRVLDLLDVRYLLPGAEEESPAMTSAPQERSGSRVRHVVVANQDQEYGIPVSCCQEITFVGDIDETFRSGILAGALQLRGSTIPVLNSGHLLGSSAECSVEDERCRILVLNFNDVRFGLIVEEIREILTVMDVDILPMPAGDGRVGGICELPGGRNVMLLDIARLVENHWHKLSSMARLGGDLDEEMAERGNGAQHHLITEHCYLVFSIAKHFAIELRDVQEIIECDRLLRIPCAGGHTRGVINLRGQVVPVINLRAFYQYPRPAQGSHGGKLIISRCAAGTVALEVDSIVTIYKQEQYYATPSLNPQLSPRKDTLDRLIEFDGQDGFREHVLVVNVENLITNHL